MGNQQPNAPPPVPSDEPTAANEPDTDSTCVVSPSQPLESLSRKAIKPSDVGDHGERKKKKSKPREKKSNGRKSVKQLNMNSGRSSKSTSKSSSRGKSRKDEVVDPVEMELRRAFRGEGRDKARFISTVQETTDVPKAIAGSTVKFESMQTVVNVMIPHHRTFKKKNRSKHDPWRRYGALKKLHQIGGWAYHPKDLRKNSSRRSRGVAKSKLKYYEIKKGETFFAPPPPNLPITKLETVLEKDKRRRNSK